MNFQFVSECAVKCEVWHSILSHRVSMGKTRYEYNKQNYTHYIKTQAQTDSHPHTHTHARTHARTHTRTHARTHTHTHTHTHTPSHKCMYARRTKQDIAKQIDNIIANPSSPEQHDICLFFFLKYVFDIPKETTKSRMNVNLLYHSRVNTSSA